MSLKFIFQNQSNDFLNSNHIQNNNNNNKKLELILV